MTRQTMDSNNRDGSAQVPSTCLFKALMDTGEEKNILVTWTCLQLLLPIPYPTTRKKTWSPFPRATSGSASA